MNPVVITIAELALRYGPALAKAFQELMTVKEPTAEQWAAVWALAEKSHDQHMAEARARAGLPTALPKE